MKTDLVLRTQNGTGNMITTMYDQKIDLQSIELQIQIARLKLGSVLDQLEARTLEQQTIDQIRNYAADVDSEVDRLLDALRRFLPG